MLWTKEPWWATACGVPKSQTWLSTARTNAHFSYTLKSISFWRLHSPWLSTSSFQRASQFQATQGCPNTQLGMVVTPGEFIAEKIFLYLLLVSGNSSLEIHPLSLRKCFLIQKENIPVMSRTMRSLRFYIYSQVNKLACHSFTRASRRQVSSVSETKDSDTDGFAGCMSFMLTLIPLASRFHWGPRWSCASQLRKSLFLKEWF